MSRPIRRRARPVPPAPHLPGAWPGALAACVLLLAGCAPISVYRGPTPAPGALTAFSPRSSGDGTAANRPGGTAASAAPAELNRWLRSGSPDASNRFAGTLVPPADPESMVVILEGDNRTGYRMKDLYRTYYAARGLFSGEPGRMFIGLFAVPWLAFEAVVPQLDGLRDLHTKLFTGRPMGGRERQVLLGIDRMLPADLLINAGDLVFSGHRGRLWEDFERLHRSLRARVPYIAAPGNHEKLDDPISRENWDSVMGPPARPESYWYALDVPEGPARFVFLDSNVLTDVKHKYADSLEDSLSNAQLAWADSALAAPVRYRFVVLHHPLVSMGHYPRDWAADSAGDPVPRRRAQLLEICARRNVTAILSGHEHLYHRVYLRKADGTGFWHITSGGGGGPLYPIDRKRHARELARKQPAGLAIQPGSDFGVAAYHFCRIVLPRDPRHPVRMDVYRSNHGGSIRLIEQVDLDRAPAAR